MSAFNISDNISRRGAEKGRGAEMGCSLTSFSSAPLIEIKIAPCGAGEAL
jgi:hypothetical protein